MLTENNKLFVFSFGHDFIGQTSTLPQCTGRVRYQLGYPILLVKNIVLKYPHHIYTLWVFFSFSPRKPKTIYLYVTHFVLFVQCNVFGRIMVIAWIVYVENISLSSQGLLIQPLQKSTWQKKIYIYTILYKYTDLIYRFYNFGWKFTVGIYAFLTLFSIGGNLKIISHPSLVTNFYVFSNPLSFGICSLCQSQEFQRERSS